MDETDSKTKDKAPKVVNWDGAITKHSCTDIICLLLFLAFLGAWGFVGVYSMLKGDINTVIHYLIYLKIYEY